MTQQRLEEPDVRGQHRSGEHATDRVVVLAHPRSRVEARLISRWIAEHQPGARVLDAVPTGLTGQLDDEDLLIRPLRVAWHVPVSVNGEARFRDLVAAPLRRAPWPPLHGPLLATSPTAASVVAGEPAAVGDLRRAFDREPNAGHFEQFVLRRAVLACDRAERRLAGDRYKVPRLMVEHITASQEFAARAGAAAARVGDESTAFVDRVRSCLAEMVAVQSPVAIDVFRALTSRLHSNTWSVEVDVDRLAELRELNKKAPLVFLPSHRSYVDPLVMAEVLHRHDFPRNHVLGGDNMSFGPFGPIGRRAGVIFIRRSFGDDAAYKFAIREYLGHLMAKRFNLEWYIEGGRTRTGKLRHPRIGLLRYLVDAMRQNPERDAILVPTSIMYEQLHEVGAVVAEQTGATKRAEGAFWFARYLRDQRRHIGGARITFGEPFGLRQALAEAGEGAVQLEKVAFRICHGINDATPVMRTSVVAFALLSTGSRALTLAQIAAVTEPLLDYLDSRAIKGPHTELRSPSAVRATLDLLAEEGVVHCYAEGEEPVWSIPADQAHVAAFYRNGAVHHLVMRSILELGLINAHRSGCTQDINTAGSSTSIALRDLLKFEFFFTGRGSLRSDLEREMSLIDPDWRDAGAAGPAAGRLLAGCRTLVAPRALRPIFEAQLVLAELLAARQPGSEPVRADVIDECLRVGTQKLLQRRLRDADSVSRELYAGAWELAANRGLVADELGVVERRQALVDELRGVLELLELASERDDALIAEVLDGDD